MLQYATPGRMPSPHDNYHLFAENPTSIHRHPPLVLPHRLSSLRVVNTTAKIFQHRPLFRIDYVLPSEKTTMSNAGGDEEVQAGLAALRCWLSSFPLLESYDCDDADAFSRSDFVWKLVEIAAEIFDAKLPSSSTVSEARSALHDIFKNSGGIAPSIEGDDNSNSSEFQFMLLSSLLCHALSETCPHRPTYVQRIMGMSGDVQRELMRILQENAEGAASDVEETADYSTVVRGSAIDGTIDEEGESDDELPDSTAILDRSTIIERIDHENGTTAVKTKMGATDEDNSYLNEDDNEDNKISSSDGEAKQLRATIEKLQKQLVESRQQERNLLLQVDEMQAHHKAEMIRLESQSIQAARLHEEKYMHEISELKGNLEHLRSADVKCKEMKEEVTRLRDELDVLNFSQEKLAFTEEQLRKCREKLEDIGDAKSALEREEKAHSASVDRCVALENELAQMKPLKRQLEEYKVRATDSEVALAECREDLRRLREKSFGLEGANEALKRGVNLQKAEVGSLQRRLQREGEEGLPSGGGVGAGMSELNPELMQELNMLRSEYTRLKEFEEQREADNVQRLIESCEDTKRLSERFKEQFLTTKNHLEDTLQSLQESQARESKLQNEVADWSERHRKLVEEMKDERIKSHRAALDMERKFNDDKKALSERARGELKDMEDKLMLKIENERKQHNEKLERLYAERNDIEKRFGQQLTELREQSSANLRSTKEALQQRIDELEQSKIEALEKAEKEKQDELDALTHKGKAVLREKLKALEAKAQESLAKAEFEIKSLEEKLNSLKAFHMDYEAKAKAKITKKNQRISILESQSSAAAATHCELEEKVKKAERTSKELVAENDRLRRQMGSRGPGGASQTQLEELVSVCNSLREENRRLKDSNPPNFLMETVLPDPSNSTNDANQGSLGISKSALIEYRQEFEERIQSLEDDKRDLVMRNAAAMSEAHKAERRCWELEEELNKLRSELTTLKLAMQRNERRSELTYSLNSSSKARKRVSSGLVKENATPNISHKARDFTPTSIQNSNKKSKSDVPSLMDLVSKSSTSSDAEAQNECKQS
eukprot:CCRYP_014174-RA/>CCRYP_014174-RA protein AED:0.02 eAED:0.02 QI:52/1/1/1/0.4/0.33/6/2015/1066